MKKYSLLTLVGCTALILASCLKDKKITDREYGMEGISDVKLIELPQSPNLTVAVDYFDRDTTFALIAVRLNSDKPATEDIKVTLQPNAALVTAYNASHGTSYTAPPASIYSFDNLTVTIPAGSREGYLKITTNPADVAQGAYAFGFTVASVDKPGYVISENYKNQVVLLGVKNQYDGVYILKGTGFHATNANPAQPFPPFDVELHTSGVSSVILFDPVYFHDYVHPWITNTGGVTGFGSQWVQYTINPTTNKVTVTNAYPGAVTHYTMAPGYDSRYDPATKTIYAKYGYNYLPGPVFNPASQREWVDTLIYQGPR